MFLSCFVKNVFVKIFMFSFFNLSCNVILIKGVSGAIILKLQNAKRMSLKGWNHFLQNISCICGYKWDIYII